MSDANLGDGAIGRLSEAEGNAWDALWDDADIICTCDGCNYYSPTYDPDRECSLAAHIKAISAAIVREHTERAWDEGAIKRSQTRPEISVRDDNPYRTGLREERGNPAMAQAWAEGYERALWAIDRGMTPYEGMANPYAARQEQS